MTVVTEAASLAACERAIESHLRLAQAAFVEIGRALRTIRNERLHREAGHETFDDYCRKRWDIERTYAHRLMWCAELADLLPTGNMPQNERQARELARLKGDPEGLRRVMAQVRSEHADMTAAHLADAVDNYLAATGRVPETAGASGAAYVEPPEVTRARYGDRPQTPMKELLVLLPAAEFDLFAGEVMRLRAAWNLAGSNEVVREAVRRAVGALPHDESSY
jgi:hypothetical protein